jgi:hypothetical protein
LENKCVALKMELQMAAETLYETGEELMAYA